MHMIVYVGTYVRTCMITVLARVVVSLGGRHRGGERRVEDEAAHLRVVVVLHREALVLKHVDVPTSHASIDVKNIVRFG